MTAEIGKTPVVFFPGWGTDARFFDGCAGDRPVFSCGRYRFDELAESLRAPFLAAGPEPAVLVGWSLGGFLAADFARSNPGLVRTLLLVGVRRRYTREEIDATRQALSLNPDRFLRDFHARCLYPSRLGDLRLLRGAALAGCPEPYSAEELLYGLDVLELAELSPHALPDCPVIFVHGEKDVIAPFSEARELAAAAGRGDVAFRLLPGAPHAAFRDPAFMEILGDV